MKEYTLNIDKCLLQNMVLAKSMSHIHACSKNGLEKENYDDDTKSRMKEFSRAKLEVYTRYERGGPRLPQHVRATSFPRL